jgi:hypothetical protein
MKPLEHYLADWSNTNPVRIPERIARELCKATQRGTVPREGRILIVMVELGRSAVVERIAKHRYRLHSTIHTLIKE